MSFSVANFSAGPLTYIVATKIATSTLKCTFASSRSRIPLLGILLSGVYRLRWIAQYVPLSVAANGDAGRRPDTESMVSCMATKKVTVTIPEDLLDEIRAEAAERGLSAYVAEALRFKRDRDHLLELADWLQEEHGALTDGERAAAFEDLENLDAEHERRHRAAEQHGAREAA